MLTVIGQLGLHHLKQEGDDAARVIFSEAQHKKGTPDATRDMQKIGKDS